ncbi:MAG TPA: glycosyltransferase family 2 protein [Cyclobacteriaceae bacterium]|nr:glycosyltransferase family 2 protein [Cyclobacteriaceae bacterium]
MFLIEVIFALYFLYVVSYTFIFSVAGLFYRNPRPASPARKKFAVFIPAYKEDGVIVDVAQRALAQTYPADRFRVIVIADQLMDSTIDKLKQLPIDVVRVSFESSTKVKSLNHAMAVTTDSFDYAVVLDADNIMKPDFLERLDAVHSAGYRAIQGQRLAKNKDNPMAFLDGLSEAMNNHIYRQGTTVLGLSCSISGSGVSFDYELFKKLLGGMTSVGGFDRELEVLLLGRGVSVIYYKDAAVYDEKVQKTAVFENQRKRWIASQYRYLARYFGKGCKALLHGDFRYFNSAVLRNIQLPRLINLGLLFVIPILLFPVRNYLFLNYWIWPGMLGVMSLAMALAIPGEYYNRDLLRAALRVPGIFWKMFMLMFKLKGANRKFIHTPHGKTE